MRRATTPLQNQTSEPLIVVEEPNGQEEPDNARAVHSSTENSSNEESPTMNPYLLSPWRDARETRKHSLPTPQCSGITASQVRRLSERGDETRPGPRQTEFLATLSSAPAPVPGGRRHSVVTISKVPPSLFGRNRRESVSAYPSAGSRVLAGRRDSATGPPSTEPRGSVHNLQLDIMDDIVQARKVRMKLWTTSNERVCEVQPMDESLVVAGSVQRYTNPSSRRFSDFVGTTLAPIPSSSKRRASELQTPLGNKACPSSSTASKLNAPGIVCTNTDLISILSSLASSAMEINQCEQPNCASESNDNRNDDFDKSTTTTTMTTTTTTADERRDRLKKTNRSNSFDVSVLHDAGVKNRERIDKNQKNAIVPPSSWFVRRHQPSARDRDTDAQRKTFDTNNKCGEKQKPFAVHERETNVNTDNKTKGKNKKEEESKVVWDERSGSLVDAQLLGSAIEVFLRRGGPDTADNSPTTSTPPVPSSASSSSLLSLASKGAVPKLTQKLHNVKAKSGWFTGRTTAATATTDDESTETCDSSICSTLKDLFVK